MRSTKSIVVKPSILALKPRQILLMKQTNSNASAQKPLLLLSVALFLKTNGFSKTLNKFLSEAQIQMDATNDALVDLEELYIEYLNTSNNGTKKIKGQKEQDEQVVRDKVKMLEAPAEELGNKGKDKEKKRKKNNLVSDLETAASATEEKSKDEHLEGKISTDCEAHKKKTKEKERKKTTKTSVADNVEYQEANSTILSANNDKLFVDKTTKCKTKKKTKDDSKCINLLSNGLDDSRVSDFENDGKDNKGNKKRKRNVSDENDTKAADTGAIEESKRRKIDGIKLTKENHTSYSVDQLKKLENRSTDEIFDNSSVQKTKKKQLNGSVEKSVQPKTAKAFQRVKDDEVVFTDERLKDNSYWAKDGADTGYGAKAQEVLGQVRGRDFRHEKTKKKRGSYRGGQIDLLSHSVKFNYSDDE